MLNRPGTSRVSALAASRWSERLRIWGFASLIRLLFRMLAMTVFLLYSF